MRDHYKWLKIFLSGLNLVIQVIEKSIDGQLLSVDNGKQAAKRSSSGK